MARTNIDHNICFGQARDELIAVRVDHLHNSTCGNMDEGDRKVVERLDVEDEESRRSRIRMLTFKHPAKKC